MKEASLWATPNQLHNIFVMLLVHCEVSNLLKLWKSFLKDLSEDIVFLQRKLLKVENLNLKKEEIESYTLIEIELLLRLYDKSLSDYPNMSILENDILERISNSMIIEESNYDIEKLREEYLTQHNLLNDQQRRIFDVVVGSVEKNEGGFLFLWCRWHR